MNDQADFRRDEQLAALYRDIRRADFCVPSHESVGSSVEADFKRAVADSLKRIADVLANAPPVA